MRRAVRVTLCAMYSPGRPFGISSFTRARRRRAFINSRLVVCGMCAGLCVCVCLYQYVCVREPPLEHAQSHTHARIYHRRPSRARVDPHLTLSLSIWLRMHASAVAPVSFDWCCVYLYTVRRDAACAAAACQRCAGAHVLASRTVADVPYRQSQPARTSRVIPIERMSTYMSHLSRINHTSGDRQTQCAADRPTEPGPRRSALSISQRESVPRLCVLYLFRCMCRRYGPHTRTHTFTSASRKRARSAYYVDFYTNLACPRRVCVCISQRTHTLTHEMDDRLEPTIDPISGRKFITGPIQQRYYATPFCN